MQEQVLDHEEIEWQLEAVELALVTKWLEGHPSAAGVAIVPGPARELSDVYYDTEDWRLYRAAYAMRIRRDGQSAQATMKARVPAEGGLRRRREISQPLGSVKKADGLQCCLGSVACRRDRLALYRPLLQKKPGGRCDSRDSKSTTICIHWYRRLAWLIW